MDIEISKKQNKKVIIFAIILSILSIGLLVFGFMLVSSDKVIMLQSISNLSSKFSSLLKEDSDLLNQLATAEDIGVKSNIKLIADGTDTRLSFDYLENKRDKKSSLSLQMILNNENLLDANFALNNNNVYFFLKDITPNYYHTPLEYLSFLSGLSSNDYDKIISLLQESVTSYINNEDIKKEKVEITYQGKKKKVNQLTYIITNKTVQEIAIKFLDSIKQDKTLLTSISSYLQQSKEETIKGFDKFLESLNYQNIESLYEYRIYYYGFNQIVSYELEEIKSKTILEYKIEKKEIIRIYQKEIEILSLEITKNKDQYEFNGYIQTKEKEKYPFKGSITDNTMKLSFNVEDVEIQMIVDSVEQKRENHYYYKDKISISSIINDVKTDILTLDIDFEYYFNQKVNVNIEDSIPISQMTEEDMEIIQNNIQNHPIYQIISGLLTNKDDSL